LRLQGRFQSREVFRERARFAAFQIPGVFHNSLSYLKGQVQPWESGISLFERLHNPERVKIMIETLREPANLPVQLFFTGVRKRGVADVVDQG
jgi:predicted metallopeptidase